MKPLQRITTINKILIELTNRGFSWNDVYNYLSYYVDDLEHPDRSHIRTLDDYFSF